jgi:DNA-binding NarL/FixJ family response regulator
VTRPLPGQPLNSFTALIVQDAIFRSKDWFQRITDVSDDFVLVRFPDAIEHLVRCCLHFETSIALVDRSLFDLITPAIRSNFTRSGASVRLVVKLEGSEPPELLESLLIDGCHGFVTEGISRSSLKRVLRTVCTGEIAATRKTLSNALARLLARKNLQKLSRREQEVIALLGKRLSNRSIAQELFISEETLRWHLRNLYTKTDLANRGELVEYAESVARDVGRDKVADSPIADECGPLQSVRDVFSSGRASAAFAGEP